MHDRLRPSQSLGRAASPSRLPRWVTRAAHAARYVAHDLAGTRRVV